MATIELNAKNFERTLTENDIEQIRPDNDHPRSA